MAIMFCLFCNRDYNECNNNKCYFVTCLPQLRSFKVITSVTNGQLCILQVSQYVLPASLIPPASSIPPASPIPLVVTPVSQVSSVSHVFSQSSQEKKYYNISPFLVKQKEDEKCKKEECNICLEKNINSIDMVKLNCDHNFCGKCIINTLNSFNNDYCVPRCAFCRVPMKSLSVKNPEIYDTLVSEHCM